MTGDVPVLLEVAVVGVEVPTLRSPLLVAELEAGDEVFDPVDRTDLGVDGVARSLAPSPPKFI